jgi:hypothetical protein
MGLGWVGKIWKGAKSIKNPVKKLDETAKWIDKGSSYDDIKVSSVLAKAKTAAKIVGGTAVGGHLIHSGVKKFKKKKDEDKD